MAFLEKSIAIPKAHISVQEHERKYFSFILQWTELVILVSIVKIIVLTKTSIFTTAFIQIFHMMNFHERFNRPSIPSRAGQFQVKSKFICPT